jgi:uncharacterized protein YlxP (DUF503 family)
LPLPFRVPKFLVPKFDDAIPWNLGTLEPWNLDRMVVGLLSVELHIPYAQSLKDKRMVLRSLKDRLKKFNVSVAEVEYQNVWQRAGLGVVTISTAQDHVDRELQAVAAEIERLEPGLVSRTEIEFLT